MIAKITAGQDLNGALKYNLDKVDENKAKIIGSVNCITNGFSDNGENITFEQIERSFAPYLEANNRTKNVVFSCSLNPETNEAKNMSDETYLAIAKDFMTGMGYGNQPFIVVRHNDIERPHIHIVSVRVDADGKKINDSMEHVRCNRVRQELEAKYGLTSATEASIAQTREDKAENVAKFVEKTVFTGVEKKDKRMMKSVLNYVHDHFKPQDLTELNKVLRQFSLSCKLTDDTDKLGRPIQGCLFAKIDANGHSFEPAYKGSALGKKYSLDGLNSFFAKNQKFAKERETIKLDISQRIDQELVKNDVSSIYTLAANLKRNGIIMDIHANAEGRLTGVSFIDNATGYIYKGSELGREYSINNLQKLAGKDKEQAKFVAEKNEVKRNFKHGEVDIKKKISSVLHDVKLNYKPESLTELNGILAKFNVNCFEIEGKNHDGKDFKGCKYCLLDDNGQMVGKAISGSIFGRDHSLNGLNRRFKAVDKLSSDDFKQASKAFNHLYREWRKTSFFESDLIEKLPSNKSDILAELCKQMPSVKQRTLAKLVDKFVDDKQKSLTEITSKERSYVLSQMQIHLRFASLLEPDKRRQFLHMVDIDTDGKQFSHAKNNKYHFAWPELCAANDGQRVFLNPFKPLDLPASVLKDARLGKKEKEVVKAFVSGDWAQTSLSDRRISFFALSQMLSQEAKTELHRNLNMQQSAALMLQFQPFGAEKMAGEMLTRGFVIIPATKKDGTRTFVVGSSSTPVNSFVEVPQNIVQELVKIKYDSDIYPNVKNFVFSRAGKPTQKHIVAANLATARDYNDLKLLDRIVDRVERINPDLANMLRQNVKPDGSSADFDRMINTVLHYKGEHFEGQPMTFMDAIKTNDAKVINNFVRKNRKRGRGV